MFKIIITSCGNSEKLAKNIAKKLKAKYSSLTIKHFPDGDTYLKFNASLKGKKLIIVQSFQPNPEQSLYRVVFAAQTAKSLGTKKVILVAPYLAFMRQDKRFHPGEAITSKIMAKLLNNSVDKIITIDPHLHRYHSLNEIFKIPVVKLTANQLIADYIKKNISDAVIIGPDGESDQWAVAIAKKVGINSTVMEKTRYSSRKVAVKMKQSVDFRNKNVVIVDDIISTGHTIIEAAKKVKGAKSITVIAVHGLFVEGVAKLKKVGIEKVITTNTIENKAGKIDVKELLVNELKK